MKKNARVVATAITLLTLLLQSCNTLSSGRKYTLAKVDRDLSLVEPHRLIEQRSDDLLDEVNPTGNWGLTMNGGFLPFLDAIQRPEVVVFVTVRIREPDEAEQSLLWEHVYLNSEDKSEHMTLNKNSFLPRDDIPLLPPIVYEGQDVFVQIRVIELDQEDNKRTQQLINTAASGALAFEPDLGVTASVFQTALTFLVENNADDIEFQYDFALTKTPGPITYRGVKYDNVLNPRVGKYVVIKTEHRERMRAPDGILETVGSGLRYGAGEILKYGSLGIINWAGGWFYTRDKTRDEGQWDFYQWLFQYPFRIGPDSWLAPQWHEGRLYCQHDLSKPESWFYLGSHQMRMAGNRIATDQHDESHATGDRHLFEDQGYIVFSIVPANHGVDVKALSALADQKRIVENLAINTSQLSPEQTKQHMDLMTTALENYATERAIRKEYLANLASAQGDDAIAAVKESYKEKVEKLGKENQVHRAELLRFIDDRAEKRAATSSQSSLSVQGLSRLGRMKGRIQTERYSGKSGAGVRIAYLLDDDDKDEAANLEFRLRRQNQTDSSKLIKLDDEKKFDGSSPFGRVVEIDLAPDKFPEGAYELLVLGLDATQVRNGRLPIWITADPTLEDVIVYSDDKEQALIGSKWRPGTRAYLRGKNFKFVDAVKVTEDKSTRRLDLHRLEISEDDGSTRWQYWIEHDVKGGLTVDYIELAMVDEYFFRDLDDKDSMALPRVPTNAGLWQNEVPVLHETWEMDTERTVKGTGLALIESISLELADANDNRWIVDAPLSDTNTVKHNIDGDVRLVKATMVPIDAASRFNGRNELIHDARQPAVTKLQIEGNEVALPSALPAKDIGLIGQKLDQITQLQITHGTELKTQTVERVDGKFTLTTALEDVSKLEAVLQEVKLDTAKANDESIVTKTIAANTKIELTGEGLNNGSKLQITYGDGKTVVLDIKDEAVTPATKLERVESAKLIIAPWRRARLDKSRLTLKVAK